MIRAWTIAVLFSLSYVGAAVAQTGSPDGGITGSAAAPTLAGVEEAVSSGATVAPAPLGGAAIPLGATDLYAGGLSPAAPDPLGVSGCLAVASQGVGALGTASIFNGDGTLSPSTNSLAPSGASTSAGCGGPAGTDAGTLATSNGVGAAFQAGNIPLGAITLSPSGISPVVGGQAPGTSSPAIPLSCNAPAPSFITGQQPAGPAIQTTLPSASAMISASHC
jgi:hypothetical protein